MAGHLKVSVVVAVYNPGPNLNGLISSLDAQTLGPDEVEVILVDDGSTDGTRERLVNVAAGRPNVVVAMIPNSGWPGRPRNVGTDLARGEYVFYADHDDEFFPRALEQMYAMAAANSSDVVYGKVIRMGLQTPYWELAKADRDHADLVEDHLLVSRSTHKLFRRSFLVDHDIRFLEGKVRLEDHHFMGQVLARSPEVSILASEPCYRWIHRMDGSNTSSKAVGLDRYFRYFTASVQLLQADDVEDRVRDEIAVVSARRMFLPVRPAGWLKKEQQDKQKAVKTLRIFLETCVPERLDNHLPALKSQAVAALRSGDVDAFDAVQAGQAKLRHSIVLQSARWDNERLLVDVEASLVDSDGNPIVLERLGDELALSAELGALTGAGTDPCVLSDTERGTGEITVRHRQSGVEWPVESVGHPRTGPADGQATLNVHITGTVDPVHGFFGRALDTGIWDVLARVQFLGENQVRKIPADAKMPLPRSPELIGDREILLYRTQSGTLALKIVAAVPPPPICVLTAGWETGNLVIAMDIPEPGAGTRLVVRQRGTGHEQHFAVQHGQARISLGPSIRGDIFDFWLRTPNGPDEQEDHRLAFEETEVSQHPPYRIYATVHGSFSVKHIGDSATPSQRARGWLARHSWSSRPDGS